MSIAPQPQATPALSLGLLSAQFAAWRSVPMVDLPTRATIVTGTVRAVEQLPLGRRITVERPSLDGATPLDRTIRLRLKAGDEVDLATGDTVRVRALLSRPAPPAYPGAFSITPAPSSRFRHMTNALSARQACGLHRAQTDNLGACSAGVSMAIIN